MYITITPSGVSQGGGGSVTITANRACISDGSGNLTASTTTSTQIGYLSTVSSNVQSQLDAKQSTTLTSAHILVGDGTNVAQDVAVSGDLSLANTGAFTIAAGAVTNAKIAAGAGISVNKLAAQTASRALASDASGFMTPSATTSTELGYVSGVTSAIQTQLNAKEPTITVLPVAKGGTNSGTALNNNRIVQSSGGALVEAAAITASRALASDVNGIPVASATTATELGYVNGVTSAIQTQIDSKVAKAGDTMSGNLNMGGFTVTNLAAPSASSDATTKTYVDSLLQGVQWKASVKVATTANITLSGTQTIDGVAVIAADRVLVKNQTLTQNNGIYIVAAGAWSRSTDCDTAAEITNAATTVEQGTVNGDSGWIQNATVTTLGTDPVTFIQMFGVGTYSADGQGIVLTGSVFSLGLDGSTLSKSATGVKVADGGIANTQVAAGAAIAVDKLAAVTASRALVSDGSGFVSPATTTATEIGYVNGVTSSIQTQLNAKEPTITVLPISKGGTNSGTALSNHQLVYSSGGSLVEFAAGTSGQVLKSSGAGVDPSWVAQLSLVASPTPYYVGPTGAPYTTIQSAITAAASVATVTAPVIVIVRAGRYIENITLAPFVYVISESTSYEFISVILSGTVTANLATANSRTGIAGFSITSGASTAITVSGSTAFRIYIENVDATSTGADCISISNASATVTFNRINASAQTSGNALALSAGTLYDNFSIYNAPTATSRCIYVTGGSVFSSFSQLSGYAEQGGTATIMQLSGTAISSGSAQCVIAGGTGTTLTLNPVLNSTSTNVVTGAGVYAYEGNIYANTGSGLAGTLNGGLGALVGALKVDPGAIQANSVTSGTFPIARGGTNSSTALSNSRVMVSTGGAIVESTTTTTNLSSLDTTTSLTTQLAAKAPLASPTFTGLVTADRFAVTSANVASSATLSNVANANALVRITGSTDASLVSIVAGANGQTINIYKLSSGTLTFVHEDAGSTAANRLEIPSDVDIVIPATQKGVFSFIYDTGAARWVLLNTSPAVWG